MTLAGTCKDNPDVEREILAKHVSDKKLVPRLYRECSQLSNKKIKDQIFFKWTRFKQTL